MALIACIITKMWILYLPWFLKMIIYFACFELSADWRNDNSANTEINSLKFKECFQVLQIFLPFWIKSIDYNLSFLDDALCRTFSTMLNKSDKSVYFCPVPKREIVFSFSPLSKMWAMGLSYMTFNVLRCVPPVPILLGFSIIYGCWILSTQLFFLHLLKWSYTFTLYFVNVVINVVINQSLIDLQMLNHTCFPGINPTWLWHMTLYMYCSIWLANIF